MSFYGKLAIFWIGVYSALWLLSRFPNSKISQLAFTWHGPVPYFGELKSHYHWRWVLYALNWLAQIVILFAIGFVLAWWRPAWSDSVPFLVVWAFTLPLLAGIAILGAILAGLAALKAKLLGPNPAFSEMPHEIQV